MGWGQTHAPELSSRRTRETRRGRVTGVPQERATFKRVLRVAVRRMRAGDALAADLNAFSSTPSTGRCPPRPAGARAPASTRDQSASTLPTQSGTGLVRGAPLGRRGVYLAREHEGRCDAGRSRSVATAMRQASAGNATAHPSRSRRCNSYRASVPFEATARRCDPSRSAHFPRHWLCISSDSRHRGGLEEKRNARRDPFQRDSRLEVGVALRAGGPPDRCPPLRRGTTHPDPRRWRRRVGRAPGARGRAVSPFPAERRETQGSLTGSSISASSSRRSAPSRPGSLPWNRIRSRRDEASRSVSFVGARSSVIARVRSRAAPP